jgi:hypothetical protein
MHTIMWHCEIPYEGFYPTELGIAWKNGKVAKLAIGRKAKDYEEQKTFTVVLLIESNESDDVRLYVNGLRHDMKPFDAAVRDGHFHGPSLETRQDLECCNFTLEKFPELIDFFDKPQCKAGSLKASGVIEEKKPADLSAHMRF